MKKVELLILFPDHPSMEAPLSPVEKEIERRRQARSKQQDGEEGENTAVAPLIAVAKAGESIQGFVVLIVNDPKGVLASALDITFHGKEETRVYIKGGTDDYTVSEQWSFLELKLPMPSLAKRKKRARRSWRTAKRAKRRANGRTKFEFLPASIKFPFQWSCQNPCPVLSFLETLVLIRYFFKAELHGSGRMWNYNKEENIHVESSGGIFYNRNRYRKLQVSVALERLHKNPEPIPYNAPPVTRKISCCFPMGSISLAAQLDNIRVHKGQDCRINISCRNHSAKEIDSVKATLLQRFSWKACSKTSSRAQSLLSMDFTHPLLGQGSLATQSKTVQQAQDISWELREIFRELSYARHSATFTIPRTVSGTNSEDRILCSYFGGIITISHLLELEVSTSGRFVTNPSLQIGLLVEEEPSNQEEAENDDDEAEVEVVGSGPATYVPPQYEDAIQAPVIYVPRSHVSMGGTKVDDTAEDQDIEVDVQESMLVPSDVAAQQPSLKILLQEMSRSAADWGIVERKIQDPDWSNVVFSELTPDEYALILQQVTLFFDQPQIAACLARALQPQGSDSSTFTCAHVVAALKVASKMHRSTLVEKTICFCSDLATNQDQILSQLTDWEKLVTKRAFAEAQEQNLLREW